MTTHLDSILAAPQARAVTLHPAFRGELILTARRSPLELLQRMAARGGEVVHARIGPRKLYLLNHPDLVRALLSHTGSALTKERALRLSRVVLGEGLLTSEGAFHRQQRRRIQPAFHQRQVAHCSGVIAAVVERHCHAWSDGEIVAVDAEMMRLTLEVAAQALFGTELGEEVEPLRRSVLAALQIFDRHRNPLAELLNRLPLPATLRMWRARRRIDRLVYRMIRERRGSRTAPPDLLSLLLATRDGRAGGPLTDRQIRDEIVTILLAGHETTALALTWSWYLLARHPEVETRLHAEVDEVLGGRSPAFEDLRKLVYTRQVVSEAMRLFPPVWAVSRQAVEEVTLGPYHFPRGATLMVCQYTLHRDPTHWPDPERFAPERFAADAEPPVRKFTYLPFSAGVRGCIGEHFAWTECILVMAAFAQRWKLRPREHGPIGLHPGISLRPARSIEMQVIRR